MVQAIITISDDVNMILNVVKAKYGLKDKSEAISTIAKEYQNNLLEPELKPEFIDKIHKIEKEKSIKVNSFEKRYGL